MERNQESVVQQFPGLILVLWEVNSAVFPSFAVLNANAALNLNSISNIKSHPYFKTLDKIQTSKPALN